MRKIKKGIALLLASALVLSATPVDAAKTQKAKKLTISNAEKAKSLMVGDKVKLKVKATPTKALVSLKYASSKKKVVSVSKKGVLTAKKAGKATITVTDQYSKKSKKLKVTVTKNEGIVAAEQSGARTFTVTGLELDKESIVVKKDGNTVSATVEVNDAADTAMITTNSNIVEATYTISMGETSQTVEGQAAKATEIKVLSDYLVLDDYFNSNKEIVNGENQIVNRASFTYMVCNQFGEDVTKQNTPTGIQIAGFPIDNDMGTLNDNGLGATVRLHGIPSTAIVGQTKYQAVIMLNSGDLHLTTTKELTLSDAAKAKSIQVTGIYNPEGKELVNGETDEFYVLFDVVDQYDVKITDPKAPMFDQMIYQISPGLTNMQTTYKKSDLTYIKDTEQKVESLALALSPTANKEYASGTAQLSIMNLGGANTSYEIVVGYGTTVNTFNVTPPAVVVQGEDIEFEYEALDVNGEVVTDMKSLRAVVEDTNYEFVKENGVPKLYLRQERNPLTVGYHTDTFRTKTHASSMVFYNVMNPARPTEIVGITDTGTGVIGTNPITFKLDNFLIEDQYGRRISTTLMKNEYKEYAIRIDYDDNDFTVVSGNPTIPLVSSTGSVAVKPVRTNTSKNLKFVLASSTGSNLLDIVEGTTYDMRTKNRTPGSEYEQKIVSASLDRISKFEVSDIAPISINDVNKSDYFKPEVKTYGVLSNGAKIKLTANEFSVSVPDDGDLPYTDANGKGGLAVEVTSESSENDTTRLTTSGISTSDFVVNDAVVDTLVRKIDIVINNTGDTIEKDVKIVNQERKIVSFSLVDPDRGGTISSKTMSLSKLIKDYDGTPSGKLNVDIFYEWVSSYTDNFGIKDDQVSMDSIEPKFFISDIDSGDNSVTPQVSGNGTTTPTLSRFVSGTSFTLTFDFGNNVKRSVGITVK
ncbi:MAG: Ig-like domain-containing protein [Lachnospiraceae bacterium]